MLVATLLTLWNCERCAAVCVLMLNLIWKKEHFRAFVGCLAATCVFVLNLIWKKVHFRAFFCYLAAACVFVLNLMSKKEHFGAFAGCLYWTLNALCCELTVYVESSCGGLQDPLNLLDLWSNKQDIKCFGLHLLECRTYIFWFEASTSNRDSNLNLIGGQGRVISMLWGLFPLLDLNRGLKSLLESLWQIYRCSWLL
jgi:hypothetical protein